MGKRLLVLLIVAGMSIAVIAVSTASATPPDLPVEVTKAPVAGDGTTAGAVTDIVLTFADPDPSISGIGSRLGARSRLYSPMPSPTPAWVRRALPCSKGGRQTLAWFRFHHLCSYDNHSDREHDHARHDTGLPADRRWEALAETGASSAERIVNPGPGKYDVGLTITPDGATPDAALTGTGVMTVIPHARPSVNIVSVLSGNPPPPPFKNVRWQTVPAGTDPDTVGLYLGNTDAEPFVGVVIVMVNPNHYRFVQQGRTVGHVGIDAPAGTDG
jgi:hypothetical protein